MVANVESILNDEHGLQPKLGAALGLYSGDRA
jgi:hypothetical protein